MAGGRRDSRGRSLRDLDLQTRLFRYPCSYLIYSDSITALPAEARQELWRQLVEALSGRSPDESYKSIPVADRQSVIEILRETKVSLK